MYVALRKKGSITYVPTILTYKVYSQILSPEFPVIECLHDDRIYISRVCVFLLRGLSKQNFPSDLSSPASPPSFSLGTVVLPSTFSLLFLFLTLFTDTFTLHINTKISNGLSIVLFRYHCGRKQILRGFEQTV